MSLASSAVRAIDAVNEGIGRLVAWLTLAMVLVQFIVVVQRYVFGVGSILMQESVTYMHALVFMVGAGYTLLHEGHVRVDVIYREASWRFKAWVDMLGALLLLLPVCAVIFIWSWGYVANAWAVLEGSKETSGLPGIYLLKTVILVFAGLVGLQGLSMLLRSALRLLGALPPPVADGTSEETA